MWTTKKPINIHSIKKILIIQFEPFGEVFLTSAILEPIKKKIPNAEIYFLTKEPYHITIHSHPFLDKILKIKAGRFCKNIINNTKLFKFIYDNKFDLIIDQQNNLLSHIICLISKATIKIGYQNNLCKHCYNYHIIPSESQYKAIQKFDLLQPLGISNENWRFYVTISQKSEKYIYDWLEKNDLDTKKFIVFSPGSPFISKQWNLKYYSLLGDLIFEKFHLSVILLWAENEYIDCQYIYDNMKHKPIIAPSTTINQALALLNKTEILICNDGGINHLSCATETKTIAIFGTTNPDIWSPAIIFEHHHHLYKENFPSDNDDSFGISPHDVLNKIDAIINIT
jgi:ADP-heptose:LPS heptosyltransferase